jgi:hypothetical protein
MKCPRCQHHNPQGARFCEECAAPLARTCSNCGAALSATAKFCHACAHPAAAGAGAPSPSPDSYTPKHLAERILTSKAALEGDVIERSDGVVVWILCSNGGQINRLVADELS